MFKAAHTAKVTIFIAIEKIVFFIWQLDLRQFLMVRDFVWITLELGCSNFYLSPPRGDWLLILYYITKCIDSVHEARSH